MNWRVKQDLVWTEVKADSRLGAYHPEAMLTESVVTTFENQWDVMPAGRVKVIHGIGAVCPFSIDITEQSKYTGIFQPGQVSGLIRMSPGADFTSFITPGLTPAAAMKFLRTGVSSANVVFINSLLPMENDNHNFFAIPLRNHVPDESDTASTILLEKFCQTGHCVSKVGLSDICSYDQDGNYQPMPIFPFKIEVVPGDVSFQENKPNSMEDFMSQFRTITMGTKIYGLKAYESPDDFEGTFLGNVVTTDTCTSSFYGDTKLFFKHQYIEEDIKLKPEWSSAYYDQCHCNTP